MKTECDHDDDVTVESTLISLFDSFSELLPLHYKKMKTLSTKDNENRNYHHHHSDCDWNQHIQYSESILKELNDIILLGTTSKSTTSIIVTSSSSTPLVVLIRCCCFFF